MNLTYKGTPGYDGGLDRQAVFVYSVMMKAIVCVCVCVCYVSLMISVLLQLILV